MHHCIGHGIAYRFAPVFVKRDAGRVQEIPLPLAPLGDEILHLESFGIR